SRSLQVLQKANKAARRLAESWDACGDLCNIDANLLNIFTSIGLTGRGCVLAEEITMKTVTNYVCRKFKLGNFYVGKASKDANQVQLIRMILINTICLFSQETYFSSHMVHIFSPYINPDLRKFLE